MRPRRGATGLSGVLVIDKPAGLTSHDVVARLRSATGERRIGHAGTLDPMATGVLIVLVGSATRLERYLSAKDKSYSARIAFGSATDTLDAEGTVVAESPVPSETLDPERARLILAGFLGPGEQMPPQYSAIKRNGVASHRLARAGVSVDLEPRTIVVHDLSLESVDPRTSSWEIVASVSKGTYVRSLARDIGEAAGTLAHLAALRRTAIGAVTVEDATSLETALEGAAAGRIAQMFVDPLVLLDMPAIEADPAVVSTGRPLPASTCPDAACERCAVIVRGGLGAVYRRSGDTLRAETVFVPEVSL